MTFSARKTAFAVVGLVAVGYAARLIQQRYFARREEASAQPLLANADFQPREQPAGEEHLRVSLGEFLPKGELRVG